MSLDHNDTIVFFTDGLTEARSPSGQMLQDAALQGVIRECDGSDSDRTAQRIEELAVVFQGGQRRDDLALVVLRACVKHE